MPISITAQSADLSDATRRYKQKKADSHQRFLLELLLIDVN